MSKLLTIQLPEDLEQELLLRANQLNSPLESFVLESLQQLIAQRDPDDDSIESVRASIRQGWHEAMTGQTYPISQLWDGIDAD
jgi:predicted transcriptional regulator